MLPPIKHTYNILYPCQCRKLTLQTSRRHNLSVITTMLMSCLNMHMHGHTETMQFVYIGRPNDSLVPLTPNTLHIIQIIKFTCCHDRFPPPPPKIKLTSITHSSTYSKQMDGMLTHSSPSQPVFGGAIHEYTIPRGVHCTKHVRVYVSAQKGY